MSAISQPAARAWLTMMIVAAAAGCGAAGNDAPPTQAAAAPDEIRIIAEVFETTRDTLDNIDSPAVWHGPGGEHWLLATAKEGNVITISDARTGESIGRAGGAGSDLGQFSRPNGIAVIDDLVLVVERDNRRVQALSLPGLSPLGSFGTDVLKRPYGIAVYRDAPESYVAYVTDAWEVADDIVPPDSLLDDRVHQFRITREGGAVAAEHIRHFGETSGPGVLHVVESIEVDPAFDRLLVAEEEEGDSKIMVYTLEGAFTGDIIGAEFFPNQAEGIRLYGCGERDGYWIATDQGKAVNTFHVFDRNSLAPLGSFRGRYVMNTDGIAVTQDSFGSFTGGAFFAVHDDGSTVAFQWSDIADALGLRSDCTR